MFQRLAAQLGSKGRLLRCVEADSGFEWTMSRIAPKVPPNMRATQSFGTIYSIFGTCIASLAINACGGSPPPAPAAPPPAPTMSAAPAPTPAPVVSAAPAPAAAAAPAPERKPEHKFHHPAVGMLLAEAGQVGLKPEQQTAVDAIKADLDKQADSTKEQRTQLTNDIADGIAAGKLDKAKIDADQKKLEKAADATAKGVQDSINKLHQTLDAAQRKKLVELMQAKAEEMHEHGPGEPGKGPHGPGGEPGKGPHHEHAMGPKGPGGEPGKAPGAEPGKGPQGEHAMEHKGPGEHGMHPFGMGPRAGMEQLAEVLGLTAEQRDKLKTKLEGLEKSHMAAMKDHHGAMQKHMKAMGDAFVTDKFDAKKAGVGEKFGDMIKMMMKARIAFVEAVLSVLTPEQRSKFAEHIRQHGDAGED